MKEFEIAIIGTGNLGRAIAHGFASQIPKEKIILTRRHASKLEPLANLGFFTTDDNVAAAKNSNIIVLCVQPKQVEGVLKEIDAIIDPSEHTIVSTITGVSLEKYNVPQVRSSPSFGQCQIPPLQFLNL